MSSTKAPEAGTWAVDSAHTTIGVAARHLMFTKVRGSFKNFTGTILIGAQPGDSSVDVTIDAASIDTGVADRDGHMRSPDFLDVANHPTIEFRSTKVREVGQEHFEVDGSLTIRGVSRPVTLAMTYLGLVADPWGNQKAMFSAATEIDREDWGLTWNAPLEAGGWLVSKSLQVELEVQAAKAA
jgi:polyisoprenoid-binding protein YceI